MTADLIIIGGGAAGMAAAIEAKRTCQTMQVILLEKKESLGKKLKATGNGRCNLTHMSLPTAPETIAFFESLGIPTRSDDAGRVYPFSESAPGVTETFRQALEEAGVMVICEAPVTGLSIKKGTFKVKTEKQTLRAKNVLLATGGKAGAVYGSTGDGYTLAKSLGHQVTKTLPILTGVCCEEPVKALKGIRAKGTLSLLCDGETVFSETGEIQFTDYGLSGICAFNLSRHLTYRGEARLAPYQILVDLAPGRSFETIFSGWQHQKGLEEASVKRLLTGMFKPALAEWLIEAADLSPKDSWRQLTKAALSRLENLIHKLPFKPSGTMGFKMAQCTSGGIVSDEIDPNTMMSKLVPGCFFAGEITDYDGPCGGYNLDYAFTTGRLAGRKAAERILEDVGLQVY